MGGAYALFELFNLVYLALSLAGSTVHEPIRTMNEPSSNKLIILRPPMLSSRLFLDD
jgi:hypothetical protein